MYILVSAIIFSVLVVIATYYFASRMSKGTTRNMNLRVKELAQALGLPEPENVDPSLSSFYSAELSGKVDGRDFYFTNYTRSEKTSDSYNTEFWWKLDKPIDNSITISRESIKSTLKKQFGSNDVEIGNKEFDETFLVKSDNAELVKAIFTDAISFDLLKKERGFYGTLIIEQNEVKYEEAGVLLTNDDLQRLLRLIELCKDIAIQIETLK